MAKYLNCGKYNRNYKYLILTSIFMVLEYYIPSTLIKILINSEIIEEKTQYIFYHDYILDIFRSFGMLLFSLAFYLYEKKMSKSESNIGKSKDSNLDKGCFKNIIVNDKRIKQISDRRILLSLIIIVIIWFLVDFLSIIISALSIFSYYTVILLTISYINSKMFKLAIFKHQKLAIYFNFIILFIFQLVSFILSMISESEDEDYKNIYREFISIWFLPIGLIIHFLYVTIYSYVYSKLKWLMDLKQISLSKLFMIYSSLGFLINIIICVILTFIKCKGNTKFYFCSILDKQGNYYLDNILLFFKRVSLIYEDNEDDLIYATLIIFIDMILNSLYVFFFLSILKNLTPVHFFFIGSITGIIIEVIKIFKSKIFNGYYFVKEGEDIKIPILKFLFDIIGNFLAFIGFLVYLEIIELNFCGFNYNLRRKIIERSIEDSIQKITINEDQNESLIDDGTPNIILELSDKTNN